MAGDAEAQKRAAATAAVELVRSGMVLGLGTGSTVRHFLELVGEALRCGHLREIVGVPTSEQTARRASDAGIRVVELGRDAMPALTVDGTDEVTPGLDLIKGMGGALLREKMVAQASERVVIIADAGKRVDRLGTRSPLPVEVVDWGLDAHRSFLERLGARVHLRVDDRGAPVRSDNGNVFLDCTFDGGIEDAEELESRLARRAGVVDTGLFLGIANLALVASDDGVTTIARPESAS